METSTVHNKFLPDKWLFIVVYPLLALLVVHVGNDNTISHLLTLPSYYTDLLLAFGISFSIGLYFHWLYRKLVSVKTIKMDFPFLIKVFIAGLLAPVVFAMLIEMIYLNQIGISVADSSMFYLEIPLVAMSCVLINLIYILLILSKHSNPGINNEENRETYTADNNYKNGFNACLGNKVVRIADEDVAYFMISDRVNFLVTTGGKRYLYDDSLENISKCVNPNSYIQLNRQFLARRSSILSATQTNTRRLEIELSPGPDQSVYVAKNKAAQFLSWLKSE